MRTRKGYDPQPRLTCRFRVLRNAYQLLKRLSMPVVEGPSFGRERYLCESSTYPSNDSDDAEPFRIQRLPANRLSRPTVPIGGIVLIAFLAMQIGVNPRAILAFVPLGGFVRSLPIVFCVPPQSGEGEGEFWGRLIGGERLTKFVQGHLR